MKHGSLFSGIGGFDLAASWMGWTNIFHCEINPFGRKVLNHHFPESVSYDDITKTDFTIWRGRIDILTGGFPCQPFSVAGKRKGTEDDRHLWPEMLRCISECKPAWIVGENVPGLINWSGGLVFEQVCLDLEGEGYEVQQVVLPACGVNAPHRRDRVWFVAHSVGDGHSNKYREGRSEKVGKQITEQWTQRNKEEWKRNGSYAKRVIVEGLTSYSCSIRRNNWRNYWQKRHIQRNKWIAEENKSERERWIGWAWKIIQVITNANGIGLRRQSNRIGKPGLTHETGNRTDWTDFPTVAPLRSGNDGFSERLDSISFPKWRNESIKAGGNAIVPQVAYQIFKAIEQIQNETI